jgi:hypothetical protein
VPIFVRLLLSIKNYLNSVEMLPTWFISASSTQIRLTDGREINFPDVSNGPQYYIPAGTYTKASLCDAITRTFTPLQNVMFAEGFTHADFSTTLINEGNVSVQCNWNSGGYEKGIFMPALSFKMRAMIFNRTIYGGSQAEAGERVVIHAGDGMWEHIVNIPAGYYTIGDLAGLIRAQLESFAPVRMTCDLDLNTSMITIKTTNPYTFAKNTNRPPINTQNAWIYLEKIHAGDDLTILGCPNGAVSPAQDDNRIPPYNISFTPQFSFSFCPTAVAPAIQSFVSRINGVEGTITTFTDSTFQGRIVWNLPLPIPFPILANDWFVEQGDIPDSNQWEVNGGTPIATGVDGQYVVDWRFDVLLPKVESVSAQLIFDPSSRLTGIIGLGSSPFAPTGITDLNGATKFSWLFPKPMAYPALDYVDATLTDGSADLGLDPERALEGTMIEFNGLQRKFVWSLSQASSFSKSCVVVELTTT